MTQLTESYVDSLALNAGAIKNGRDLVKKNSFPLLQQTEDGTLLFGECKGSGKEPYRCSVDFLNEGNPVFRCTCPSRQFPCKHNLGLMYAFTSGKSFTMSPIPQDIQDKREKAEKREEKKQEEKKQEAAASGQPAPPAKRKTNTSALLKKITAQLEGISIAEKLMLQIVQSGLGTLDKKALQTAEEQAKQLGNYYIPGIQTALRDVTQQFRVREDREQVYPGVIERLLTLQMLLKKSRAYLEGRVASPDSPMDSDSTLEESIGHSWQMAELREHGRVQGQTELLQLAFRSYTDSARGEYVDEGYWFELPAGPIHYTRTYRPFRAAKFIKEEDSLFQVIQAKELARYPGELNARVRWEEAVHREAGAQDYLAIRESASRSFPEVIKLVKNQIKNPLSDRNPVALLLAAEISKAGDSYILTDGQGKQIPLADIAEINVPAVHLLPMLNQTYLKQQAVLVMFEHNMEQNRLEAQPLSIVTPDGSIRLLY
jgi:hypothetical protein